MKKLFALLLACVMVLSLAACGDKDKGASFGGNEGGSVSNVGGGGVPDIGGIIGNLTGGKPGMGGNQPAEVDPGPPVGPNATPAEAFEIITLAMMEVMKGESQTIGMDLTGAFGMPTEFMSFPTYDMSMFYAYDIEGLDDDDEPSTDHRELESRFQSMTCGGDAMEGFSISAEGETLDAAVYFTGDKVLVRRTDRSEPLVRYTVPDGAAISTLQPLHRFRAVLSEDHPEWLSGSGWNKYMDRIAALVRDHAGEVTTEERTVTAGAMEAQGNTYILKLNGDAAASLAGELRGAWMADIQIRTALTMAENAVGSNKKEGYTLDQYFDVFKGANPSISMAVSAVEGVPASMACYMESDGGKFHVTVSKLEQGDGETVQFSAQVFGVSSPTGGGYRYLVENSRSGKDPVIQDNRQTIFAPDGTERMRYSTHSQYTGNDQGGVSSFTYALSETMENSSSVIVSNGTFQHERKGEEIDARFDGQVTMTEVELGEEESTSYDYRGTLRASEREEKIDIPQFIEASGVDTFTRQEFSDVLVPDSKSELPFNGYEKMGAYSQVLYAFAYMMGDS